MATLVAKKTGAAAEMRQQGSTCRSSFTLEKTPTWQRSLGPTSLSPQKSSHVPSVHQGSALTWETQATQLPSHRVYFFVLLWVSITWTTARRVTLPNSKVRKLLSGSFLFSHEWWVQSLRTVLSAKGHNSMNSYIIFWVSGLWTIRKSTRCTYVLQFVICAKWSLQIKTWHE